MLIALLLPSTAGIGNDRARAAARHGWLPAAKARLEKNQ
jgi:hypothetical protein